MTPEKETPADAAPAGVLGPSEEGRSATYRFLRRAFFVAFLRAAILGFTPLVRLLDTHRLCVALATRRPDLRRCRLDLTALVRLLSDRSTHHLKAICLRSLQKPQG